MDKQTALKKLKAMTNEPKDQDENVISEFYNNYSAEIIQIQQEDNVEHQTDAERSWYALMRLQITISMEI